MWSFEDGEGIQEIRQHRRTGGGAKRQRARVQQQRQQRAARVDARESHQNRGKLGGGLSRQRGRRCTLYLSERRRRALGLRGGCRECLNEDGFGLRLHSAAATTLIVSGLIGTW